MKAHLEQRIIEASTLDAPTRDGDVLEVGGDDGHPPYLVRWTDGHLGLLQPGPGSLLRIGADRPEIEDEVAVARARRALANRLLEMDTQDGNAVTGK
jgi:hypothetical protein